MYIIYIIYNIYYIIYYAVTEHVKRTVTPLLGKTVFFYVHIRHPSIYMNTCFSCRKSIEGLKISLNCLPRILIIYCSYG